MLSSLRTNARLRRILFLSEFPAAVALLLLSGFLRFESKYFFTAEIWEVILSYGSRVGIIAIGMTLLMISGEFDLSVYGTAVLAPIVAYILWFHHIDIWIGLAGGLLAAAGIGLLNAAVALKAGIPSLITTLGTGYIGYSASLVISGETTLAIGTRNNGLFFAIMGSGTFYSIFTDDILWFIVLAVLIQIVISKTRHGNWSRAAGGNRIAAQSIGVAVNRTKTINFVLCAVLAGVSGMLTIAEYNAANANTELGVELAVIVAVVIGGTAIYGGSGTALGTVLGSIVIGTIFIGLDVVGVNASWYEGTFGITLIILGAVNEYIRRYKARLRYTEPPKALVGATSDKSDEAGQALAGSTSDKTPS